MNAHLDNNALQLYLDDALRAEARENVDAHLAACDACRAELAELQIVFDAFDAWRSELIPRDVSVAVMARVRQRPLPNARAHWVTAVLILQAWLAILLLVWLVPPGMRWFSGVNMPSPGLPAFDWDVFTVTFPALPNVTVPLPALALWMWGAVIVGAGAVWLLANRLLLKTWHHTSEAS